MIKEQYACMKKIKRLIKIILTYIKHPVLSIHLIRNNAHSFVIGNCKQLKGIKYISLGNNVTMSNGLRILALRSYENTQYDPTIYIGDNVYSAFNLTIMAAAPIIIGENTLIASDVVITSENHGTDPLYSDSYASTPLVVKPVTIGKGCWIGEKSIILPGVNLGDRCIVAAGSIVTKSFPAYSMVGGVPAKVIKRYNLEKHLWERIVDDN